jgi:nicotinamide riboside transporter PnuC
MSNQIDLKELERKAFRATYQDGLWDIYFGLIAICMAIFIQRPAAGYTPMNIVLAVSAMAVAYGLFWAGKKFITLPRIGQVRFGPEREMRKRTLVIVLSVVVLIQGIFLAFQLLAWTNPGLGAALKALLPDRTAGDLLVASVGALFVGPSMIVVAYFRDFPRGYFIAIMLALAVFLIIYLNQPIYPILIGLVIAAPGVVLFMRFLRQYPLHRQEAGRE